MIELICDNCKKTFYRSPSGAKGKGLHFCCVKCRSEYYKRRKEQRTCKTCGNTFLVYKLALEKSNTSGNFCSRKCYTEYQKTLKGNKNNHYTRKDVKCPTCGRIFKALPSKMKMYKNTFCSFECKNAYMKEYIGGEKNCNWKGGESKYRGDFNEVKRSILQENSIVQYVGKPLTYIYITLSHIG